jgi:hypothetical protein
MTRNNILKLPDISKLAVRDSEPLDSNNPFHMPSDVRVFDMREEDKKNKLQV